MNLWEENGFFLGEHLTNPAKQIFWNPYHTNNPHLMIVGLSGSGKTYLLKKIIQFLSTTHIKTFVIDFHGDINTDNEQELEFTSIQPQYGISLFEFEKDNYKKGGIKSRVNEIVAMIKKNVFKGSLSPIREAILKQLFLDTYKKNGYDVNDPTTWQKDDSNLPDLSDTLELMNQIEDAIKGGFTASTPDTAGQYIDIQIKKLIKLNKDIESIKKKLEKEENEENTKKLDNLIETKDLENKKLEKFFSLIKESIDNKQIPSLNTEQSTSSIEETLDIYDFNFYNSKNVLTSLESLKVYISNLVKSNIFIKANPQIDRHKNIFRFNLSHLDEEIMYMTADLLIQRIFTKSKQQYKPGDENIPHKQIRTYIVIDESKLVLPSGKEKENPFNFVNRIVSEARKFGLGIILVSQRVNHYSEEMLSNIATKIVLKVSNNDVSVVRKKLGIKESELDKLSSRKFGAAIMNQTKVNTPILLDGTKR